MVKVKRSVTLDNDLLGIAQRLAGPRGLSRLLNEALRSHLQLLAVEALEAELAREHGPIPPEVQAEVSSFEWPR
jgi:hypothetical protein